MEKLESLIEGAENVQTYINGRWVPCRPLPYPYVLGRITRRARDAWAVLRGKADAFTWPEGQ